MPPSGPIPGLVLANRFRQLCRRYSTRWQAGSACVVGYGGTGGIRTAQTIELLESAYHLDCLFRGYGGLAG